MLKLISYIFYYTFFLIFGRLFFTLFFYKSYNPPAYGYSSSSKRQMALQLDVGVLLMISVFLAFTANFIYVFSTGQEDVLYFFSVLKLMLASSLSSALFLILFTIIYCVYCILCELTLGRTLGKRIVEIKTLDVSLKKPHAVQIVLRNTVKLFSMLGVPVLLFLAYRDKKRRWLHDRVAQTVVVDTQKYRKEYLAKLSV
ncbi:MAG: RDD family protein [Cyclobacteriaceae bacterium]